MDLDVITSEPQSQPRPTPLLFVHGAWHGAWCWTDHFLPYFARHGYISHTFDLRGHGKSDGQKGFRWTRIADYVSDVERVVRQMDQSPVLIGHSMGGLVVQKYLERHEAPAAVLLASVPPGGVLRTTLSIAAHHPLPFLKANATMQLYPIVGTPQLTREAFFSEGISEARLQAHYSRIQNEAYRAFLDMIVFSLPRPARIKTPLLVLGGEKDTIFSRKEVEATARAYHTQATFFNMAHDMMLEDGWQDVADHILRWLDQRGL